MVEHASKPLEATTIAFASPGRVGMSRSHHMWLFVAAVIAIAGVLGSVAAARSVAGNDAGKSQKSFERASTNVASTLQLAIQHENDLVVNAAAYVVDDPMSAAGRVRAVDELGAGAAALPGVGIDRGRVIVPASGLGRVRGARRR